MPDYIFNEIKNQLLSGGIDFGNDDIRALLVMTNTTAGTEDDVNFIGDITTLDECDDTGYSRQSLTGETVTEDMGNDRAEFDCDNFNFANNGDATRDIDGLVIYKHVTNDADSIPIAFFDISATLDGNTLSIQVNAEGLIQLA